MSIKFAILGLLHYKDMHGYRIKEHIERNFGNMWSINYGQIYPNLKKLETEGLVTKKDISQINAPNKKLYMLTEKGRETFTEWLFTPPDRGMLIRDPFLLRFIFFGFGDRKSSIKIIDEQIVNYERQLKKRKENIIKWEKQDVYVRLMADLGLNFNEMMLKWLNQARAEINKSSDGDLANAAGFFSD